MTEYGDRINQLDLNVTKSFKFNRMTIQPKIDFFNLLNRAPVTAILGLNYGTAAYNQPSVVLEPTHVSAGRRRQVLSALKEGDELHRGSSPRPPVLSILSDPFDRRAGVPCAHSPMTRTARVDAVARRSFLSRLGGGVGGFGAAWSAGSVVAPGRAAPPASERGACTGSPTHTGSRPGTRRTTGWIRSPASIAWPGTPPRPTRSKTRFSLPATSIRPTSPSTVWTATRSLS